MEFSERVPISILRSERNREPHRKHAQQGHTATQQTRDRGRTRGSGRSPQFLGSTFTVSIGGQTLSRDFDTVTGTLAEELLSPAFPEEELEKLKLRTLASLKQNQEETRVRAIERLTRLSIPLRTRSISPPLSI
jgi:hypothetical protein